MCISHLSPPNNRCQQRSGCLSERLMGKADGPENICKTLEPLVNHAQPTYIAVAEGLSACEKVHCCCRFRFLHMEFTRGMYTLLLHGHNEMFSQVEPYGQHPDSSMPQKHEPANFCLLSSTVETCCCPCPLFLTPYMHHVTFWSGLEPETPVL